MPLKLQAARDKRKKIAVISHERSGTHFLMNSFAANFDYIAKPWWNLDYEQSINFHAPSGIERYLRVAHDQSVLNILKSHHSVGFFEEIIDYLTSQVGDLMDRLSYAR